MKLFSQRLTTLKSKLYAIVFASFVVRVVAFFALPNTASNLAPDEGMYAGLAEVVAKGVPVDETQFGEGLYLISRAFTVPASLLVRVGFSGLDAVRLIASLYGLLTFTLIAFILLRIIDSQQEPESFISKNQKSVLILFAIFGLLPSHLIWSVLGLREAAMEFWVLVVFSLVFYVFAVKRSPSKLASLAILIAIPLVFSSRPQVGWVVGVTLLTYFLTKVRLRASQILIPITLMGIVLGYVATTPASIERIETFKLTSLTGNTNTDEFDAKNLCKFVGQEVIIQGVKFKCLKGVDEISIIGLRNPAAVLIDQAEAIPQRHEGNKVGAASAIKTLTCPITNELKFQKYFCIAYRAPYTTYTFLVRPILGADVTSSSSLFAAIENVFWLVAFIFVIVMLFRNRRLAFFGAIGPSLLFFSTYSIGAGAYEGNMGTAFRHKSLILWVVLLLLASTIVATQQRKAGQEGISGSSQE